MASNLPGSEKISKEVERGRRQDLSIAAGLFALTLLLYLPALRHEFVNFDDQIYVTENPHVQGGWSWAAVKWAFTTFRTGNWHPVTWLSHINDCYLFGLRAWGHHLTNTLLHAANAALVFWVLRRLTQLRWQSAAVAALFAWHPAHVESVAWVAERKDVLSAFFFLLALTAYARHAEGRKRWYWAALGLFAAGLMAKPMLVTFPFVLLLLDYWPLQRRAGLEKIPFFLLSAADCIVTFVAQRGAHAVAETTRLPLGARWENASVSCLRYAGELLFRHRLAVFYPYENVSLSQALVASAILGIAVSAVSYSRRSPYWLMGILWFLGMLVPIIGLVQVGAQGWADRYTYLPSIGFFVAIVWGLWPFVKYAVAPVCAALVIATSFQLSYWQNTRTLFEHTAAVTEKNYVAAALLGSESDRAGDLDQAEKYCQAALRDKPNYSPALFFLGHIDEEKGRLDDAITHYRAAVALTPYFEQARLFLAAACVKKKDYTDAETNYLAGLEINPDSATAHNGLGKVRQLQGRLAESQEEYTTALRLDPDLAPARNNLGVVLLQEGKTPEGLSELRHALVLNPTNTETAYNLIEALHQQGLWDDETRALLIMAAGYSQVSEFSKATRVAQQALASARDRNDRTGEAASGEMLRAFAVGKPVPTPQWLSAAR